MWLLERAAAPFGRYFSRKESRGPTPGHRGEPRGTMMNAARALTGEAAAAPPEALPARPLVARVTLATIEGRIITSGRATIAPTPCMRGQPSSATSTGQA